MIGRLGMRGKMTSELLFPDSPRPSIATILVAITVGVAGANLPNDPCEDLRKRSSGAASTTSFSPSPRSRQYESRDDRGPAPLRSTPSRRRR